MLTQETQSFLRKVHPLDLLPEADLEDLVGEVALEYFPRGVRILEQGAAPAEYLYLIQKGGVRVYVEGEPGDVIVLDARSEEDYFGLISLVTGDPPRATIEALEDTICYLVPKPKLLDVLRRNPSVNEKLLKSYLVHFIDRTHAETKKKYRQNSFGQPSLLTTRLGEVLRKEPVTIARSSTIQDAARRMAEHKVSSVVVTDESGEPAGIVTDRDLREKVVATGRDLAEPIESVMSSPLVGVEVEQHCFEALLAMMRHGIHHVVVLEDGHLRGVATHHDFMVLQGASPAVLVKEVAKTRGPADLAKAAAGLHKTVSTLVLGGAKPNLVTETITELMERYVNRMIDFQELDGDTSPPPYTLFVLGRGGRRELFLDGCLELGIAYQGVPDEGHFEALSKLLAGGPVKARLRREDVRGRAGWRTLFESWTSAQSLDARLADFLDIRAIRGETEEVEALRRGLRQGVAAHAALMRGLAAETLANRPPLGFFRRFVVEKSGEHRNELDLYEKGLRPLVEVVRLRALEKGIASSSTKKCLRELQDGTSFPRGEEVEQACEYLATLLLHHQLAEIEAGKEADSFLNLVELAPRERKTLKEAFQLISQLYERLEGAYEEGTS